MIAGKEQSDNSSATSRRASDCLTALSLFLINFLKLQDSHFFRELSNKIMISDRYMSWTLYGGSKLTPQRPLLLIHITTSFEMQPISMIFIKPRKDLRERHSPLNKKKSMMMLNMPMQKSNLSTDPEPVEHSPYSVYQSSVHPKMPQKSFLPRHIWETLS